MNDIAVIILGAIGSLILLLLGIIGFFLRTLHGDLKTVVKECAANTAKIDLVDQKYEGAINLTNQTTQLEIRNLTDNVNNLATAVDRFVKAFTYKDDDGKH
jgi:cobalamin biosynthesis protein CbiD